MTIGGLTTQQARDIVTKVGAKIAAGQAITPQQERLYDLAVSFAR